MRSDTERRRPIRRGPDFRIPVLVLFACFVVFMVLVGPKEPISRALNAGDGPNGAYNGLVISEAMSDNASALPDDRGSFPDWVEITNNSDATINLEGCSLSDRSDKTKFVFPTYLLDPGEYVLVYCDGTHQSEVGEALHAKFTISSIGEALYLFNPSGYAVDHVTLPTLNMNESYARMEDGTFTITDQYSPGYPNTEAGHVAFLANYSIHAGVLYLNEVMAAPRSGLRDEDGELQDWVELYNAGTERIDLSRYALSDNENKLGKWFFPEGTVIDPGQYYIVFCSGKNRDGAQTGYPHTNFGLSAEGEVVTLSNALGQIVDRVVYENLSVDCSYGRDPATGNWQVYTTATPGAPNNKQGAQMADEYLRATNTTLVYISEAMASNDTITAAAGEPKKDWVEIVNFNTEAVDISGWGLSDNINWPRKWQFPAGTILWPGQYLVVMLDGTGVRSESGTFHATYKLAKAGGETVTLADSSGRVLDKMYLPPIPTDVSYGRTVGSSGFFYYEAPTPGAVNGTGFVGYSQTPSLDVPGGLYQQDVTVSITVPPGTQVRYTLDGSVPTLENGYLYEGPFVITDTAAVRARGFESGLHPSETVSATYVLKTYYSVPVVCLVTDPEGLWSNTNGIFAAGEGIDLTSYTRIPFKRPTPLYRTLKENKVRVPSWAEMFDNETHEVIFSQGVEFGIIGQYSLDMPQKSIKVIAKSRYGSKYIAGKLFEDRPYEEYRAFVLRNSGNDCVWTRMVDGVQSRLIDQIDTTVIHQAWRPVVVYINGRYWGHYNLRERVGEYFVAQHEGVPLDEAYTIDVLESNGTRPTQVNNGSNAEWVEFIAKVKTLSPGTNAKDLKYITDRVDVDNYFDYVIFESFFANTDTGNIRFYKVPGGKWKWILYDMDYGLFNSTSNGIGNYLNPKGHGANDDIDNSLILKLLENSEMFDKFMTRFGQIFRTFTTERMLAQVTECYNILAPEMSMHFDRWAGENLKNIAADQPQTKDGCLSYWESRVERLRNVIRKRPAYCWRQVAEWFKLTDSQMEHWFGPIPLISEAATWDSTKAKNNAMTYLYGSNWQALYAK